MYIFILLFIRLIEQLYPEGIPSELQNLVKQCKSNNASKRPSITQFIKSSNFQNEYIKYIYIIYILFSDLKIINCHSQLTVEEKVSEFKKLSENIKSYSDNILRNVFFPQLVNMIYYIEPKVVAVILEILFYISTKMDENKY